MYLNVILRNFWGLLRRRCRLVTVLHDWLQGLGFLGFRFLLRSICLMQAWSVYMDGMAPLHINAHAPDRTWGSGRITSCWVALYCIECQADLDAEAILAEYQAAAEVFNANRKRRKRVKHVNIYRDQWHICPSCGQAYVKLMVSVLH